MNPPSALSGAMNRERKPFTYTPGGIDLSEIKSERMAQRLMRNAMNQGVPASPAPSVQSPPTTPVVMPNYNCLPVQVFPTFPLPANPKSLLRTRSNPDPNERLLNKTDRPSNFQSKNNNVHNIASNNTLPINENKTNNVSYKPSFDYNSGEYTVPILQRKEENIFMGSTVKQDPTQPKFEEEQPNAYNKIRPVYFNVPYKKTSTESDNNQENATLNIPNEESEQISNKKNEVKIESNADDTKNGDTNAAVTLKLSTKKSEAKTEKKVEIVKNTLPDGSVQEVKTTTTTTTTDGKTEITTEVETTTFPKDCGDDVEYEVEDEEEVEEEEEVQEEEEFNEKEVVRKNESKTEIVSKTIDSNETSEQNGTKDSEEVEKIEKQAPNINGQINTHHESHESSTTKKIVIIQSETQDSDKEDEEEEENDVNKSGDVEIEEVVVLESTTNNATTNDETTEESKEDEGENNVINPTTNEPAPNAQDLEDNEEEYEEIEEEEEAVEDSQEAISKEKPELELDQNNEEVEEEYEEAEESEVTHQINSVVSDEISKSTDSKQNDEPLDTNQEIKKETNESDVKIIPVQVITEKEQEETEKAASQSLPASINVPLIEPVQPLPSSINEPVIEPVVPLDKVEEVEIKPIGPAKEIITKTHTEITTTTSDKPVGTLSTQTEYNVVQNIVTVNRTVKTLDHAQEEIPDNIPTIKTFVPPTLEGNFLTSQPVFKPYQAGFKPEPQTERRHSLLLERLSVERQMPPEIYQNNTQTSNQTWDEPQYLQEPQSEILIVSNLKPSIISKNQQWYQRNDMEDRSSTLQSTDTLNNNQTQAQYKSQTHSFYQPKPQTQPPAQTIYQPQIRVQPSPQPMYKLPTPVQNKPQPSYHLQQQTQPTYQSQPASTRVYQSQPPDPSTVQPIYHPQPQYQQSYIENTYEETNTTNTNQYDSDKQRHSAYPSYTSTPVWAGKSLDSQPLSSTLSTQSSYLQKDYIESFEQPYKQQLSSSYVPPPWEQDSNYVANNTTTSFYQPTPSKTAFTPNTDWKLPKPSAKFSKSTPTSYIPPAPNQSFVKPVNSTELPRQQDRKTYYSEYERRYISVPEATYLPNETKCQPQPDPSPQYYYDNNEPIEVVEPQWRKELREFKEQSSKTTVQTTVRPPWEDDPKYATPKDFTPTPTWTQTLKPRSCRESSFEPEYIVSQEWPKTNTLGRGRPQSSYLKNTVDRVPDRTRGVSVDRYNPNSYQSPMTREHPPPASHILDPIIQGQAYHNPAVPAYHSRASVEPREQPVTYQQPRHRESRAPPVQSRSFKYLQWITGTDD